MLDKNLKVSKNKNKTENILNTGAQKNIIANDLIKQDKKLIPENLLHNGKVKTGLTLAEAEYLGDVIDMDTFDEQVLTFENLPAFRLAKEKSILRKGPSGLSGCKNRSARKRWTKKQKKRVKEATKLLEKHKVLIGQYDSLKAKNIDDADSIKFRFATLTAKGELYKKNKAERQERENEDPLMQKARDLGGMPELTEKEKKELDEKFVEDRSKELVESSELLEDVNTRLTNDAIASVTKGLQETLTQVDTILTNYVIEADQEAEQVKKDIEKNKKDREKKEKKTGKKDAGEEFINDLEEQRQNLLNVDAQIEEQQQQVGLGEQGKKLRTTVMDLKGGNETQLAEMATLFKKILQESQKPFVKDIVEDDKIVSTEDVSATRYPGIIEDAEKVLDYASKLKIPVPEELYYLIDIKGENANPLLQSAHEKLDAKKHVAEGFVFLMSAVSQVYYDALNRFAGYAVHDGLAKYHKTEDPDRVAKNYDIFNIKMMTQVRSVRDSSAAYANEIRKNRIKIYDNNISEEDRLSKQRRDNVAIIKNAQPTGVNAEEEQKKLAEAEKERRDKELRSLLEKDIRGTVEVDEKDMKEAPWVLGDPKYTEKVYTLIKDNPETTNLTGVALKKYLISMNANLHHNLMQLNDELPKTSVGSQFRYIPKLRDDYIQKLMDEQFAVLLHGEINFRDLLKNNSILKDFFSQPKYKAIKNRQNEIMKAINSVIGFDYFTNVKHLESLWKDNTVQALLTSEPVNEKEQEQLTKQKIFEEDQQKEEPRYKSIEDVPFNLVMKRLTTSTEYGVTDKGFKDAIEKIKANVTNNINVIDKKITLMGLCDTAKDMLKKNVLKRIGGEYLLGYDVIAQDIVEYTVDNVMAFDGDTAAIQRTWDRKFARTGLPKRLSAKFEKMISSKVNADGKKDPYYLRPKGYKVSKNSINKWEETNDKTNKIITSLKKVYNKQIKNFLNDYAKGEELRKAITNDRKQYIGGELKLTKTQWENIEKYFEDAWIVAFRDSYENGEYHDKDAVKILNGMKPELNKIIDIQLTAAYKTKADLEARKDKTALNEYMETLVTREEFMEGLKNNPVLQPNQLVVKDDLEKQIFGDPALKSVLKNKADRDMLTQALEEALRDEKSGLHIRCLYLEDVRSIENIANLSLIDYSQFFADLKQILSVVRAATDAEIKEAKEKNLPAPKNKLLLEDWRRSGTAGEDPYGIKKLLMKDLLEGRLTAENMAQTVENYRNAAAEKETIGKMRIDAILHTERTLDDQRMNFNYTEIKGKEVNQTQRVRKLNYAQQLWFLLRQYDTQESINGIKHSKTAEGVFGEFLSTIGSELRAMEPKKLKGELANLGKWLDETEVYSGLTKNKKIGYGIAEESQKKLNKLACAPLNFIGGHDARALYLLKGFMKSIQDSDSSAKKLTFADIMGEMMLMGCGKEYFEAGGAGEKVFLNSDDTQYYANIVNQQQKIQSRKLNVQLFLESQGLGVARQNEISSKVMNVIAGLSDTREKEGKAENIRKFGVGNLEELDDKLISIYGKAPGCKEELEKSKKIGELFLKRRDAIDNYPGVGMKNQGKFRIIRNYLIKDDEAWRKIMTATDDEFASYLEELNKNYGTLCDVFLSDAFKASQPVMEQYLMKNWSVLKTRSGWEYMDWWTDVNTFYGAFMTVKKPKKSILDNLDAVQKRMVKEKIDTSVGQSTLLMRLSYILEADPSAFNLLYDEKQMFDAIQKVDKQYAANMQAFRDILDDITVAAFRKQDYHPDKELDALYKEIATICQTGEMVQKQKEAMGSAKVIEKMYEKAKKGAEITDNDRAYADYNLLMQIIQPAAFTMNPEAFKLTLLEKLKDFKRWQQDSRNANIYSDRNVLDTKEEVRLELQFKKSEGKMLEREYQKELSEYREKRQEMGSVGLVAYGKTSKFDSGDIKKATSFVEDELFYKYLDAEAEQKYKDKGKLKELAEIRKNNGFKDADEEFIKGLLVERVIAYGEMDEEKLKGLMVAEKERLVSLDTALRKAGYTDEDEIKKAIVFAFAQNANRSELLLDGTHENDIKEIEEELKTRGELLDIKRPASKIAQRDYDEFMDSIDVARFTMSKEQFKEVCDKKRKQLELIDACVAKIQESTKELKLQVGLYEYFKKDIYEALNSETGVEQFTQSVQEQLDKLIGKDVQGRNDLDAESIKEIIKSYLPDSSALMQQISDKSLTAEEKLFSTETYTRADMEKEIANSGRKDLIKMFNSLTVEEQKVFALTLTFPDIGLTENEMLTSNVALRDKRKENEKELAAQEQLAAFIYDQDFSPKIDYNLVMRRLMKTDRKSGLRRISKTMFEKAFKYTQFCSMKRDEMRPKDFTKLADGRLTGALAGYFTGRTKEDDDPVKEALDGKAYYGAKTFRDLFKAFGDDDQKQDESVKAIVERFGKYNDVQMHMLLHVLQDRTAVDYTTAATRWQAFLLRGAGYANEERREVIKNSFRRPDGMDNAFIAELNRSMTHSIFDKAAETLFSYQLKDNINLENKSISKNDFADDALKRKTKIDWKLVERAMDLVEEIENDNLKIQMCRQTVNHTMDPNMPNKKAAELAREIEEKFREDTDLNVEALQVAMKKAEKDAKKAAKEEAKQAAKEEEKKEEEKQGEKKEEEKKEEKKAEKKDEANNDVKLPGFVNHFDFFRDMLVREAKKDPERAMPLISAFAGLSMNEKMLLVHALKNRDILDVSTDNTFTTAIGFNENQYVNELGRDKLADYYVDHFGLAGAKNIMATTQYDLRDAMRSLVSTQVSDARDEKNKKDFSQMIIGKKVFNFAYIGADRSTGIDWNLFANALKFVKRTEGERKLLAGESEAYRSAGDIEKYGRFKYNYQFMRKNLYRSGYRFTRFAGRRIRAELEKAIPGYGVGQRVMMACLSPKWRNKMLSSGFVKPGVSQGLINDGLGYAGLGGTSVSGVSSALGMIQSTAQSAAKIGTAVAGEGITQAANAIKGIYNVGKSFKNVADINRPLENQQELKKQGAEKRQEAAKAQTEAQKMVTDETHLNKEWILNEVATIAGKEANYQQIMSTLTDCVDVLSGSSFGVQAFMNTFVTGIRITISEALNVAKFIMSVCGDKKMMDKYFADNGPMGAEIAKLKSGNIKEIIQDQSYREDTTSRDIMKEAILREQEAKFLGDMGNSEIFRKAYGFKDFTEQASYVGWNIVQTLLQSSSPFGTDPAQFMKSAIILSAIGCADCVGKQDNDTAQKVYNKLMGTDIR